MQSFTQIQLALDTQLLTTSGVGGAGAAVIKENDPNFLTTAATSSAKTFVRSTLLPSPTDVSCLGADGYVRTNGLYAIDVIAPLDKGYAAPKALADDLLATFKRGTVLTLTNADTITVENSYMSPNVTSGAWRQSGFYCVQVIVRWYGFVQP